MKIGVVGNGMIVKRFLEDLKQVEGASAEAICVRSQSREKGEQLAAAYEIGKVYTDYPECLRDGSLDAVYIGIINSEHYEYVKLALEAGKHVICEKPFTVEAWEARELAKLAREKGLFLWEAFKIAYSPVFQSVKEHLTEIGAVKLVQCNYSRVSSRYADYLEGRVLPAFDPELSGGCMYDINLYNLHFTVGLFGRPNALHYYANKGYNGIDTSGVVVMEYDGFQAVLTGSKDSSSPCGCVIQGEQGYIRTEGPASAASSAEINLGNGPVPIAQDEENGTLAGETRAFVAQYENGDYESCYQMLEQSVLVMELLEAAVKDR